MKPNLSRASLVMYLGQLLLLLSESEWFFPKVSSICLAIQILLYLFLRTNMAKAGYLHCCAFPSPVAILSNLFHRMNILS